MQAIKKIKHQFMVFRNGIVADALRNAGMPYHVIFGLQLPQLSQIARELTPGIELARELWADRYVRESRLLACYLFPKEEMTEDEALDLARSVQTNEEADILCFRLLRYLPFAESLLSKITNPAFQPEYPDYKTPNSDLQSPNPAVDYCAVALRRNLDALK